MSRRSPDPRTETTRPTPYPRAVAPRRGWPQHGAGRAAHADPGALYLGTSVQVAGLYPLMQAAGLPSEGVPLGHDLLTHEQVCLDPGGWVGTLLTNPGIWIEGQPGVGKSAIAKRLCLALSSYGYGVLVPGDVKGEYTSLVEALGGQAIRIGRGLDRINPLDSGPLGRQARASADPRERERLRSEVNARRLEVLQGLLATGHGLDRRVDAAEAAALSMAVRLADEHALTRDPVITDVLVILRDPPQELLARLMVEAVSDYLEQVRAVIAALGNLIDGPLAGLFDAPTSTPLDLAAPAVSIDLSRLLTAGDQVVAAGLLATWAYAYNAVDTARAFGLVDRPLVIPLDELWRALRAGAGMVDAFDAMSRLSRARGEVTIMVTHSLMDTEALPTAMDRAKAAGLIERADTLILAAQPLAELHRVAARQPLTDSEIDLVASWASPTATGLDGGALTHPGRGQALLKLGQGIGTPFRLMLTPAELALYDTDAAIRRAGAPR